MKNFKSKTDFWLLESLIFLEQILNAKMCYITRRMEYNLVVVYDR